MVIVAVCHKIMKGVIDKMPTKLFFTLSNDKKRKITDVALSEFAHYGYASSSTNRIVKNCGISKGSLFQYFENKEDLYFYIIDIVTTELAVSLEEKVSSFSKELFQRIVQYSELEIAWYIQHPEKYQLIVTVFTKSNTEIYQKTEERYRLQGRDIYDNFLKNIETTQLRWEKEKTLAIVKWCLTGFKETFLSQLQENSDMKINDIKNEYIKKLTDYIEILKTGLIK